MLKIKTLIAIVLIAVGIAGFAYQGIKFMTIARTSTDQPASTAPKEPHRMPLPPVLGVVALIAGIALLLMDDGGSHPRRSLTADRHR
jgi:hypothetical protein